MYFSLIFVFVLLACLTLTYFLVARGMLVLPFLYTGFIRQANTTIQCYTVLFVYRRLCQFSMMCIFSTGDG